MTETVELEGAVGCRRARRVHRVLRRHGKTELPFREWLRAALRRKLPGELSPKLALLVHGVGR